MKLRALHLVLIFVDFGYVGQVRLYFVSIVALGTLCSEIVWTNWCRLLPLVNLCYGSDLGLSVLHGSAITVTITALDHDGWQPLLERLRFFLLFITLRVLLKLHLVCKHARRTFLAQDLATFVVILLAVCRV